MKKGNWIPMDKRLVNLLPKDRKYTYLEAMLSYSVDRNSNKLGSVNGYSVLWKWSRDKVRRFVRTIENGADYQTDSHKTGKRQAIRYVFDTLESAENRDVDTHTDTHTDTTNDLNLISPILKEHIRVAEQVQPTHPLSFEDFIGKNQKFLNRDKAEAIQYFLAKYARTMKDQHPKLKPKQWEKAVENIFTIEDDDNVIDLDGCMALIDKYFSDTERYQKNCNHSLIHFNTNGVKKNLYYEELY